MVYQAAIDILDEVKRLMKQHKMSYYILSTLLKTNYTTAYNITHNAQYAKVAKIKRVLNLLGYDLVIEFTDREGSC